MPRRSFFFFFRSTVTWYLACLQLLKLEGMVHTMFSRHRSPSFLPSSSVSTLSPLFALYFPRSIDHKTPKVGLRFKVFLWEIKRRDRKGNKNSDTRLCLDPGTRDRELCIRTTRR